MWVVASSFSPTSSKLRSLISSCHLLTTAFAPFGSVRACFFHSQRSKRQATTTIWKLLPMAASRATVCFPPLGLRLSLLPEERHSIPSGVAHQSLPFCHRGNSFDVITLGVMEQELRPIGVWWILHLISLPSLDGAAVASQSGRLSWGILPWDRPCEGRQSDVLVHFCRWPYPAFIAYRPQRLQRSKPS